MNRYAKGGLCFCVFLAFVFSIIWIVKAAEQAATFPDGIDVINYFGRQVNRWSDAANDQRSTTLGAAISTTDGTSVTLSAAPSQWSTSGGYYVQIDTEYMYVESRSGVTLTVTRGTGGSTAATHLNGATVYWVMYAGQFNQMRDAIILMQKVISKEAASITGVGKRVYLSNGAWNTDVDDDGVADAAEAYWSPGNNYPRFDGADTNTNSQEAVSVILQLPDNYDGDSERVTVQWHLVATGTVDETLYWCIQARTSAGAAAWDAYSTADCATETIVASPGTTVTYVYEHAITVSNLDDAWTAGDFIQFKIYRDPDNANDTSDIDADLDGVTIEYDINEGA